MPDMSVINPTSEDDFPVAANILVEHMTDVYVIIWAARSTEGLKKYMVIRVTISFQMLFPNIDIYTKHNEVMKLYFVSSRERP